MESGIYQEDYPIRLPANCSIKGDEFRRTIIRPLDRVSQSPWRKLFFYRDAVIDGLQVGLTNTSVDYAPAASITLGGTTNKIVITLGSGQAQASWIGKIIQDNNVPAGKAVIESVAGNTMNCGVIYPFAIKTTYVSGNWHIYGTYNYGRHYLTNPLDIASNAKNNKDIDVMLCGDATRISNITFQGHGGFAMVLDPEGQIKTKSPYGQVCTSFSQSVNKQAFRGGQFVDGFVGIYPKFLSSKHHDVLGLIKSEMPKYLQRHLVTQAKALVPSVDPKDFKERGKPGIRAQLLDIKNKKLEMDFVVRGDENSTHLLNAVSPAWTSALAMANHVCKKFD